MTDGSSTRGACNDYLKMIGGIESIECGSEDFRADEEPLLTKPLEATQSLAEKREWYVHQLKIIEQLERRE